MMRLMSDDVFAPWGSVSKGSFEQSHIDCLSCIKLQVNALVTAVQVLLEAATHSTGDGRIDEGEHWAPLHLTIS